MTAPDFMQSEIEAVTETVTQRRWVQWVVSFCACTLFILINSTSTYFAYRLGLFPNAAPFSWRHLVLEQALIWYPVALLIPPILWVGRRFRLERRSWRKTVPLHLALLLVYDALGALISLLLFSLFWNLQMGAQSLPVYYLSRIIVRLPISIISYWSILGAGYAFEYYRKYREQQLQATRLEACLVEAQLQALKMQLHPHFLFNTLHAISALMDEDIKAARRMIARLSELLRLTLENAGQQEVSLRQELEALERYLEIEQIRFQDRLKVELQIEPATLVARVPNLILQPIVENAIRHGIAPVSKAGSIEIRAAQRDGKLELSVRDDGPGLANDGEAFKPGIGLSNTRARLQQLYGGAQQLEISNAAEGGVIVKLTMPFESVPRAVASVPLSE
jgi:two-component system, LytTR family, sensor kinase